MKNTNKESTRYYSDMQEKRVCKTMGATQQMNSGATRFNKGDCIHQGASLLFECKTTMTPKNSISIKKEWIDKNKEEAFEQRLSNSCVVVNFEPQGENFFVINESLMRFLLEKLEEENEIN